MFVFPAHLDFAPDSPAPKLLYTPNNTPLHAYEHQLTSLLTKIDEIESGGAKNVRNARKALVKRIEAELEDLDRRKIGVWETQNGGGAAVEDVPVEAVEEVAPSEDIPMVEPEVVAPLVTESETIPATQPSSLDGTEPDAMEDVREASDVEEMIEVEIDAPTQSESLITFDAETPIPDAFPSALESNLSESTTLVPGCANQDATLDDDILAEDALSSNTIESDTPQSSPQSSSSNAPAIVPELVVEPTSFSPDESVLEPQPLSVEQQPSTVDRNFAEEGEQTDEGDAGETDFVLI